MARVKKQKGIKSIVVQQRFLDLIKSGEKKAEVRKWFINLTGQYVELKCLETNKIEMVVKIGQIWDLRNLPEDELELILDEAKVPEDFRYEYPCNWLYMLTEVHNVH